MNTILESDHGDRVLDPLIARTLKGEVIPFDEWLEAEYSLEEEPDIIPTASDMLGAQETRMDFLKRAERFGFPLNDRFRLCEALYGKAMKSPSNDLLRMYCDLACDDGYLLDLDRSVRTEEQDALCRICQERQSSALYDYLSMRKQQSERFRETLRLAATARQKHDALDAAGESLAKEIGDTVLRIIGPKGDCARLTDNIAGLLQLSQNHPALRLIEPLFLYRVLTRHTQRFLRDDAPQFEMDALWRYQRYQLDEDNGKNYKTCLRYLSLFEALYTLTADRPGVDAALSLYGFDHLSNLGEFYRMLEHEETSLDFGPQVEDIFLKHPFTCFERGYGDNVMLERSGLTESDMSKYLSSRNRRRVCALDRVSAYMTRNIVELTTRFMDTKATEIPALCEEILSSADLPLAQRPANESERALLLAAINQALMDAQDDWAEDYLIRAGKALIGDDPLQAGLL